MIYSYIKPRKKSLITPELRLLFIFFFITIIMLVLTYAFLAFKNMSFEQDRKDIEEAQINLQSELVEMNGHISFIEQQKELSERVFTQNTVLKDSIANVFDLVPERITLSEAKLLEKGLILYGVTPSKDVYDFMLQAPLRSIFHRTYSSFYPAQNGWLSFVSKNFIDDDEFDLREAEKKVKDNLEIEAEDGVKDEED